MIIIHFTHSFLLDVPVDSGVEFVEIDYAKPTTLSEAFNGVDKLFLNTPFQADIAELTSNIVTEAVRSGTVEHIVKLSVLGAEAEPSITMSRLHRQAETLVAQVYTSENLDHLERFILGGSCGSPDV